MKREIVLVSVPHTGTRFVRDLFIDKGFDNRNLNQYPAPTQKVIYYDHCIKPKQVKMGLDLADQCLPLIVPLRHPYSVEKSWRDRQKDVDEMLLGFRNLIRYFLPRDPFIIPVDSPKRVDCLANLNKQLVLDLETDWKVSGTQTNYHNHGQEWRLQKPSNSVIELVEDMQETLALFY